MSFPVLILSRRGPNGHADGLLKGNPETREELTESEIPDTLFDSTAHLAINPSDKEKDAGLNALLIIITNYDLDLVMTRKSEDPNEQVSTPIRVPPGVPAILYNVLVGPDVRGIHLRKAG